MANQQEASKVNVLARMSALQNSQVCSKVNVLARMQTTSPPPPPAFRRKAGVSLSYSPAPE